MSDYGGLGVPQADQTLQRASERQERGSIMSENLRDEMQLALKQTWRDRAMSVSFDVTWRAMTDAAWEVVAPELDRLRDEADAAQEQIEDDGAVLRSIAKSIRPAFPNAADLLLGIERMHWPSEAHRLNAENAQLRAELDRLRDALASVPEPSEPASAFGWLDPRCVCKYVDGERHTSPWCEVHAAADGGAGGQQTAGEQ